MTEDENVENILAALASFGVTKEKYDSFNYKYDPLKALAFNTVVTYRGRITYETEVLDKSLARGEITAEEYKAQLTEKRRKLRATSRTVFSPLCLKAFPTRWKKSARRIFTP